MIVRRAILLSLGLLSWSAISLAQQSASVGQDRLRVVQVDVPAQSMVDALNQFATQAKLRIVFFTETVQGLTAPHLVGAYTTEEALKKLLDKSGLQYRYKEEAGTVEIRGPHDVESQTRRSQLANRGQIRLAQAETSGANRSDVAGKQPDTGSSRLEEVIVTAQKREQRLQDVPIPVTAMGGRALAEQNQYRLQDYYSQVPGLALTPNEFNGTPTIAIRGVTSGDFINPAVAITVDDVPFGSSTSVGGGPFAPDLDPSDLARIEVLRGPQGTLYGASSIGGLVKYVTTDPSVEEFTARIQGGIVDVSNGEEMGYNINAALNIPLSDTFSLRASGFGRRDPGYIRNVRSGEEGVNETEVIGGHISALWRPSQDFLLKLSALHQVSELHGSPYVTVAPGLGEWEQDFIQNTGIVEREFSAFSATASAQLGLFEVTSVTGFSISQLNDALDFTELLGFQAIEVYPSPYVKNTDDTRTEKFSQELRFSVPLGDRFDLLMGGFYTHEDSPNTTRYIPVDENGQSLDEEWGRFHWDSIYAEWAGFADLTYHITDRFEVQIGGRYSQIRQTYQDYSTGSYVEQFLLSESPLIGDKKRDEDNAVTYLLTPQFKLGPDVMVYARLASGYRPGGINIANGLAELGLPTIFKPDKTENYEIGIKGEAFDRTLSFDASVYYIDWKDIQLSLTNLDNGQNYFSNGSAAASQGVELSLLLTPADGWRIGGWVAYNDAELTEAFPPESTAYGVSGDRLPYSSEYSGSLSVDYEFPLAALTGSIGGTTSYVDERVGAFTFSRERQTLPSYVKTDLRAGLKTKVWSADLYINNVADKRGVIGGGLGTIVPTSFGFIQPRAVGLSVSRTF